MIPSFLQKQNTRREMLRNSAGFAGSALLAQFFPASFLSAGVPALRRQAATPPTDSLGAMRAQMGTVPIHTQPLAEKLTLLSGPGGNVVVLNGPDGKIVVDTFLLPAWPKLKETLDGLGNAPLKTAIDTHWHVDHTDNNANLHAAGATVLAHENTKTRMAEPHDNALFGLHFAASPADALPQQTFSRSKELHANGEIVMLQYFEPAHTDTDIYIHFQKANVIHMGDTFFNGFYPVIDASTGGKINGMILAADKILGLADNSTKIVPGHGPLGNKADLTKYREMLVVARDRVQKLKTAGKSAGEIAASKPFADLEDTWGKGFFNGDVFVQMVYSAL
ncbi:MAG TPA: MBL fold metallo-hydrolase [Candidatus Acidoferrum sp.]|nr:MBL fold metallo-hydrolase [Candidatus Acidoferrum sp.]